MSKSTIEVIVETDGQIQIEAIGFKGGACEMATAAIEEALGVVQTRKHKPEFRQQASTKAGQKQST